MFMFEQEAGMLTELANQAEGVTTTGNQSTEMQTLPMLA